MKNSAPDIFRLGLYLAWGAALIAIGAFSVYQLHDIREPFAFGHARWADAYVYLFARAHFDYGLAATLGLNVENFTASGEPLFYLSVGPLAGLLQAAGLYLFSGEFWVVRIWPLIFNLGIAGLIAIFAYRQRGLVAAPLSILLFLGAPFVIKYGASNEGFQVYAIAASLAGYLFYLHFLTTLRWVVFFGSMAFFGLGIGFNWLAGFMAATLLLHLWSQPLAFRVKIIATLLAGAILGGVLSAILIQQGLATGDFMRPIRRALERSSAAHQGDIVSWSALFSLQVGRYWNYFGPVVASLNIYWLLRRLLPKPNWGPSHTWAMVLWVPGLVYALLLRSAAFSHDFLMLGFVVGATFIATLGMLDVIADLKQLQMRKIGNGYLAGFVVTLLLSVHATGAVRSAQNFERQEAWDLEHGAARVALHLKNVQPDTILVVDRSARIGYRADAISGENFASIPPFFDYFVRRPVRTIEDSEQLRGLLCEARGLGRPMILLQMGAATEEKRDRVRVSQDWIWQEHVFDRVGVFHLKLPHAEPCGN